MISDFGVARFDICVRKDMITSMYNYESTIRDLLADDFVAKYIDLVFPKFFLDFVPEKYRDRPLKELPSLVKMPWGDPYNADAVVDSVRRLYELKNDDGIGCIPLCKESFEADFFPKPVNSKESACLFIYKDTFMDMRPVAVIVPGGAYAAVAVAGEGMDTADVLRNKGYAVAILNYRCLPNRYPAPQEDLALAIKFIRANAQKLQVNGDNLTVIGFSAGGHLAATEATHAPVIEKALMEELKTEAPSLYEAYQGISVKPDRLALSYPFTGDHDDAGCMDNLVGDRKELIGELIAYDHVDASFPKTFLWACKDDPVVAITNTTKMADALKAAGVPCEMRLYPQGGHGMGVAKGTSAEGWIDEMISFLS